VKLIIVLACLVIAGCYYQSPADPRQLSQGATGSISLELIWPWDPEKVYKAREKCWLPPDRKAIYVSLQDNE